MKKFLICLMILLLSGCQATVDQAETIETVETVEKSRMISLSAEELKKKEEECRYFALFVHESGHEDCENLKQIVEDYLKETNTVFYSVEYSELAKSDAEAKNYIEDLPTIIIYSEDGVLDYLNASLPQNRMYCINSTGFKKWMEDKTEEYCLTNKEEPGYCSVSGC